MNDHQLAAWLARIAGHLLPPLREGPLSGEALGCVGDLTANAFITSALERLRPGDALLSEESPDDCRRLEHGRVWIIDPLDGTREYANGRSDWAVHVALAVDGRPEVGAVAVPMLDRVYDSGTVTPPSPREGRPVMVVSRTRAPDEASALAEHLGAEMRLMGSAGAKAMAVVSGEADIYYHSGGQHEWDNCAPVAVALTAGLHASRSDGSPILYNCENTHVPDLLIARRELAAPALEFLSALAARTAD